MTIRRPAVAGLFYPADPDALAAEVDRLLDAAPDRDARGWRAVVAPHAGYRFSGAVAASAFAPLRGRRGSIGRVVMMGTAHTFRDGMAFPTCDAMATPLGSVAVDADALASLADLPGFRADDGAHARDHALEVQLPFLQRTIGAVPVVPLLVGRTDPSRLARALEPLWGGPSALLVVSTDLSHYLSDDEARERDRATADAVRRLDPEALPPGGACGATALVTLMLGARARGLVAELLDLRTSADAEAPRDRVVGYGAFSFAAPHRPLSG